MVAGVKNGEVKQLGTGTTPSRRVRKRRRRGGKNRRSAPRASSNLPRRARVPRQRDHDRAHGDRERLEDRARLACSLIERKEIRERKPPCRFFRRPRERRHALVGDAPRETRIQTRPSQRAFRRATRVACGSRPRSRPSRRRKPRRSRSYRSRTRRAVGAPRATPLAVRGQNRRVVRSRAGPAALPLRAQRTVRVEAVEASERGGVLATPRGVARNARAVRQREGRAHQDQEPRARRAAAARQYVVRARMPPLFSRTALVDRRHVRTRDEERRRVPRIRPSSSVGLVSFVCASLTAGRPRPPPRGGA